MPGGKSIFESGEKSPVAGRYELVGIDDGSTIFYVAPNRFRIEIKKGGLFPYVTDMCKLRCVWRLARTDGRGGLSFSIHASQIPELFVPSVFT